MSYQVRRVLVQEHRQRSRKGAKKTRSAPEDVARGREMRRVPESDTEAAERALVTDVFRLQTDVARLKADVDRLGGGPTDTPELRRRVASSSEATRRAAAEVAGRIRAAHTARPTRLTAKALTDCEATLLDFQETLRVARSREASSFPRRGGGGGGGGGSGRQQETAAAATTTALQQQQEQPQQQQEQELLLQQQQQQRPATVSAGTLEYQEALVEERERGIEAIARQIGEVGEIFQDLACLVGGQGTLLEDVEANVGAAAARAGAARGELARAERAQRAARKRRLAVLAVAAAVLLVLVVVLSS